MALNPSDQDKRGILLANFDGSYSSVYPNGDKPQPPSGAWQLSAGQFVPAKMPMTIISPQPDGGDTFRYWRWCTANDVYKVRVCIQGGAFPFKYELLQAPVGATIGSEMGRSVDGSYTIHSWSEGYATITWPNPTAGTHTFQVQATDQDGNTVTETWTTTLDESMFTWIDSAVVSSGDGSFGSPLKTFQDLWPSTPDSRFSATIAKFKTGTYNIYEGSINTNASMDRVNRPFAFMKVDGETPVFDLSQGHFNNAGGGSCDGLCVYGINHTGARAALPSPRLYTPGVSDDLLFWDLEFDNTGVFGAGATDNPACIFLSDNATPRSRVSVVDCTVKDVDFQLVTTFACDYVLMENNDSTATFSPTGANGAMFLHAKDDTRYCSIRANKALGSTANLAISVSNQGTTNRDLEVCYNVVRMTYTGGAPNSVGVVTFNSAGGAIAGLDLYRNSVVIEASGSGPFAYRFYPNSIDGAVHVQYDSNIAYSDQANVIHQTPNDVDDILDGGVSTNDTILPTDVDTNGDYSAGFKATHNYENGHVVGEPN